MNTQVPSKGKKRGPKPTEVGTPLMVRIRLQLLTEIDDWRSGERPIPSRAEAARQLMQAGLKALRRK